MTEMMKAIIKEGPKPGAVCTEIPVPTPKDDEVLIKVHAAAICGTDVHYYNWNQAGQEFGEKYKIGWPLVLGHECCGTIVEVGKNVTDRKVGERVSLETHIYCGHCYNCKNGMAHACENMGIYGTSCDGCFGEYAVAPANVCFPVPDGVSNEEAALYEPAGVSMHAVQEADVKPGDTVLVNGCGPFGMLTTMFLTQGNAARVIVTDLDEFRLGIARKMGAITLNPTKCDVVAEVKKLTADRGGVDIAIEHSGARSSYKTIFDFIRTEGSLITVAHPGGEMPINIAGSINTKGLRWKGIFGRKVWDTWYAVNSLVEAKKVNILDVVTHRFTMDQVDEAFEQTKSGSGKILFIMD